MSLKHTCWNLMGAEVCCNELRIRQMRKKSQCITFVFTFLDEFVGKKKNGISHFTIVI